MGFGTLEEIDLLGTVPGCRGSGADRAERQRGSGDAVEGEEAVWGRRELVGTWSVWFRKKRSTRSGEIGLTLKRHSKLPSNLKTARFPSGTPCITPAS